jgi:16S rRNA processing protein RimM
LSGRRRFFRCGGAFLWEAAHFLESGMNDEVLVGVFGAPHGVRGEIRLKSYMAEPASIAAFGPLHDSAGREFLLTASRPLKDDLLVVRVKGVTERDAAQKLTHVQLYISREKLPPPEEDEFYCRDLIGLRAETSDGVGLGTIVAVPNYGAGDILEVAPPAGETLLFPFTRAVVPHIDLAGGRVIVEPPQEIDADPGPVAPKETGA